jgi:hypothetical protein
MLTRITFALFLTLGLSFSIVAQDNKDLVGSYLFRFEWGGTEIKLQPNGTFVKYSSNCTQVFTSSGPYSVTNNILSLTTKKMSVRSFSDNEEHDVTKRKARKKYLDTDEPFKPETRDLQIVRWGQRIYLMDQDVFGAFIRAINLGFEPRQVDGYRAFYGAFYLRVGDENKAINGKPPLPNEFLDNLLSAPVTATILKLETSGKGSIATIDRGSDDGLRKGMFLVTARDQSGSYLPSYQHHLIISVEPTVAKVEIVEQLTLGAKLTTRIANVAGLR